MSAEPSLRRPRSNSAASCRPDLWMIACLSSTRARHWDRRGRWPEEVSPAAIRTVGEPGFALSRLPGDVHDRHLGEQSSPLRVRPAPGRRVCEPQPRIVALRDVVMLHEADQRSPVEFVRQRSLVRPDERLVAFDDEQRAQGCEVCDRPLQAGGPCPPLIADGGAVEDAEGCARADHGADDLMPPPVGFFREWRWLWLGRRSARIVRLAAATSAFGTSATRRTTPCRLLSSTNACTPTP